MKSFLPSTGAVENASDLNSNIGRLCFFSFFSYTVFAGGLLTLLLFLKKRIFWPDKNKF